MDYSSLNNMLNTLEINTQTVSPNPSPSPHSNPHFNANPSPHSNPHFNANPSPHPSYVDNKSSISHNLERDVTHNQNSQINQLNFELSNPQRHNEEVGEYQKFNKSNNLINNYNFAHSMRATNTNKTMDFIVNTKNTEDKNNINDRLNNRELLPVNIYKFSNY